MRSTKNLLALIVLAVGALWSLQGTGVVGGSFMTGQSQWLYIGVVTMLVGLVDWCGRTGRGELQNARRRSLGGAVPPTSRS
ncbi:hypothetical protein [Mesorhizobium sp. M7A.F.Ca.US.010.02.1.1]|uniref:hypothetical protein n=1 Tax=Mesorhizobium sp. M7A.F.Ca.US.010.02.1.1 TaxID=2496743 RepID=UPI000FD59912|nr:hypothetical protein [Mesorhizobium sp. M7A.F.Ca.US.010.02.1.1]RUW88400.1 hypothetical protein EOA19_29725 [Mesorhizobium sp. M7A.F.Ca.US.010.02.1.1]